MPTHCSKSGLGLARTAAVWSGSSAAALRTPTSKKLKRSVDNRLLRGLPESAVTRKPTKVSSSNSSLTPLPAGWDNPTMIVTIDEKRRLTVPLALAPTTPGDAFDARFDDEEDAIVFRRIKRGGKSWLDILKACPVSIEDLPPRSREYPRKPRL